MRAGMIKSSGPGESYNILTSAPSTGGKTQPNNSVNPSRALIDSHFFYNRAIISYMVEIQDRILVVENDPIISDLIGRQALQSIGYKAQVVSDASSAIAQAVQYLPDLLIVDLNLPGLSGKDFLVALNSQGINTPVIVLVQKGMESDIIQAFRLGASDYLVWPARDAEIVSVVERGLKQVHERRDREHLARQLQQINQELQQRVRELTTIFTIGKAVTSITDQSNLFDKILEGATKVTQAEIGWFLLRDDNLKAFILAAQRNLPNSLVVRLNQPWDDGISSLVAMSGEPLSVFGEPLKRFKIASLGQAALITPVKVQKQVVGLLVVVRKTAQPFSTSEQNLLEAVCDYSSISLVNSRLFRAIEDRARSLQKTVENAEAGERIKVELLRAVSKELRQPTDMVVRTVDPVVQGQYGKLNLDQRRNLLAVQEQLQELSKIVDATANLPGAASYKPTVTLDLNEVARQAISRMQPQIQRNHLVLASELFSQPIMAQGSAVQVVEVIIGLLSNAIKFSPPGGQVIIHVDRTVENMPHLFVRDMGIGLEQRHLSHIFDEGYKAEGTLSRRFGGLGISLSAMKSIMNSQGGRMWVESQPGRGSAFHFTLPPAT
jgi:signal transduction histidine kinase/DNA-binding response OmpR family regulator